MSLCAWFLFHRNHTHFCLRLVLLLMSSPFCPCGAHICTFVLALIFCLPLGRRVCVCAPLVVTGILLNCFPFNEQGDHPCTVSNGPTKRPQYMRICGVISQTYLRFFSNGMRLSPEPQDMVPNVAAVTHGTPSLCRIGFALRVWPLLRLRTPRLQWFPTCTLRNWYPRPACGTAVRQYAIP